MQTRWLHSLSNQSSFGHNFHIKGPMALPYQLSLQMLIFFLNELKGIVANHIIRIHGPVPCPEVISLITFPSL